MIDAPEVLLTYLAAQTPLTVLTGSRIWPQRINPIEGYLPSDGHALAFRSRGGGTLDYSGAIFTQSWTFKAYGESEREADRLYRVLFDVLNEAKTSGLYRATLEVGGQSLQEPIVGWDYSLSYWTTLLQTTYEPV